MLYNIILFNINVFKSVYHFQVTPGTPAGKELIRGDIIAKVDDYDARDLRHEDAQNLFKNASNQIKVVVQRYLIIHIFIVYKKRKLEEYHYSEVKNKSARLSYGQPEQVNSLVKYLNYLT